MQLTRGQKIALGILAGGTALGAGIAIYRYRSGRGVPALPGTGKVSGAVSQATGRYLGSGKGWTDWPAKATFPDIQAIQDALDILGYGASGCIVNGQWTQSNDCSAAIKLFQSDINQIRSWARAMESGDYRYPPGGEGVEMPSALHKIPAAGALGVDGLAGKNTIAALNDAIAAVEYATNQDCLDDQGRVVAPISGSCQAAWVSAVDFVRQANQAAAQS